jgi:hypothetical protein
LRKLESLNAGCEDNFFKTNGGREDPPKGFWGDYLWREELGEGEGGTRFDLIFDWQTEEGSVRQKPDQHWRGESLSMEGSEGGISLKVHQGERFPKGGRVQD